MGGGERGGCCLFVVFLFLQLCLYQVGAKIGFFRGDVKQLVSDIQCLKPTMFVSVPRLLNRIYDKVRNIYTYTYIHCSCVYTTPPPSLTR